MAPPQPKFPYTKRDKFLVISKRRHQQLSFSQTDSVDRPRVSTSLNFSIRESIIPEEGDEDDVFVSNERTTRNCSPYPVRMVATKRQNLNKTDRDLSDNSTSGTPSGSELRESLSLGAEANQFVVKKEFNNRGDGIKESCARFPSSSNLDPEHKVINFQRQSNQPLLQEEITSNISPHNLNFGCLELIFAFIGIIFYLTDIGSDIFVATIYAVNKHWYWFGLTLGFIVVPAFVSGCFSLYLYYLDYHALMLCNNKDIIASERPSKIKWLVRLICNCFVMGPILRYIDQIILGIKARKARSCERKRLAELLIFEDVDVSLLKLFECFLESAPQLCLQLYILTKIYGEENHVIFITGQVISILISLGSLSWSIAAYFRALRLSKPERKASVSDCKSAMPGLLLQFFWRYLIIGSRVLSFALFASVFTWYIFPVCAIHFFIIFTWILYQNTEFFKDETGKKRKCAEFLYNFVISWIHLFCYFNITEGHTRLRYICFYSLVFIENLVLTSSWFIYTQTKDLPYHLPAFLLMILSFWVGILFMIIYYVKYHPNIYPLIHENKKIRIWIPFSELLSNNMHNMPIQDHGVKKKDKVSICDESIISTHYYPAEEKRIINYTKV